jgi:gamma-glutamylcyclotransferase (GGCT)/AIG2-like uncharacterized protein YtfP
MEGRDSPAREVDDVTEPGPEASKVTAENPAKGDEEFEPCLMFFYGSLMDPQMLQKVAALDYTPYLESAWVEGFQMKMWHGIYPTLLADKSTDTRIQGKAWRATTMTQCLRLQRYETSAYEPSDCMIHLNNGETVKGLVFTWAGKPTSSELAEGVFDLEHWQNTHKVGRF